MKKKYLIPCIFLFSEEAEPFLSSSPLSEIHPVEGLGDETSPSYGGRNDGTHPVGARPHDLGDEEEYSLW